MKRNLAIYQLMGLLGYLTAAIHGRTADLFGMTASIYLALASASAALILISLLAAKPQPTE
jgi:hypothetical protein